MRSRVSLFGKNDKKYIYIYISGQQEAYRRVKGGRVEGWARDSNLCLVLFSSDCQGPSLAGWQRPWSCVAIWKRSRGAVSRRVGTSGRRMKPTFGNLCQLPLRKSRVMQLGNSCWRATPWTSTAGAWCRSKHARGPNQRSPKRELRLEKPFTWCSLGSSQVDGDSREDEFLASFQF